MKHVIYKKKAPYPVRNAELLLFSSLMMDDEQSEGMLP